MNADGTDQTFLARGGSPSWSPDGKHIAFQTSASGTGAPINTNPGAATDDSDIFIVNVDDLLEAGSPPRNLTNDPTEGRLILRNCPFHAVARVHPEHVCGINHAFVAGLLTGLEIKALTAHPAPRPGACCVELRRLAA